MIIVCLVLSSTKKFIFREDSSGFTDSKELSLTEKFLNNFFSLIKLASGEADLYPRLAPTMEWDTGAADAILRGVGGSLINIDNSKPLDYNKENLLNPYFHTEL